jgi:diadenosine tetraphosphate (Ap4A) HIT family hydrolase
MATETMKKFGYPGTVIAETKHWAVLLRPQQVTLGSLVLISMENATEFSSVSAEGFAALRPIIRGIECLLRDVVGYERINYLMLMMVDPDVHFHVIPRYSEVRSFDGVDLPDHGWPGPAALGQYASLPTASLAQLAAKLKGRWTTSD